MQELCPQLNMPVIEKNFEAYDIYTADEAFMTGTPFCALPVTSLNGVPIGKGVVGEGFKRLIAKWSANTGVDIVEQITRWDKERILTGCNDAPTPYRFKTK
jgi:branched-chain amino acid aminotransferase